MSNVNKEFCYEYFDCKELDCVRRKNLVMNCWDVDDVKCKSHSEYFDAIKNQFETKLEACEICIYYKRCNEK